VVWADRDLNPLLVDSSLNIVAAHLCHQYVGYLLTWTLSPLRICLHTIVQFPMTGTAEGNQVSEVFVSKPGVMSGTVKGCVERELNAEIPALEDHSG
jgi:hypothetical protein